MAGKRQSVPTRRRRGSKPDQRSAGLAVLGGESAPSWRLAALLLAAGAFLISLRGLGHEFVLLDDVAFIRDNPQVSRGLSWDNFVWALTSREERNWMPLARWCYQLDMSLFGARAGGHHFMSALLHGFATWLAVWSWRRWTDSVPAALTAGAVFAFHPLQVEAVAWITAQKDLLCAVCTFTALGWWHKGHAGEGRKWTLFSHAAFGLALMAKSAVVGLPVFLWLATNFQRGSPAKPGQKRGSAAMRLLAMTLLALCGVALTLWAGRALEAADTPERQPWISFTHAPIGVLKYMAAFFWPAGLCCQHPLPGTAPMAGGVMALAALLCLTWSVWRLRERAPELWKGWWWWLLLLAPSSGIIAFGPQGWAERFGYVAMPGLGVCLYSVIRLLAERRAAAAARPAGLSLRFLFTLSAGCFVLGILNWRQQGWWRDSLTLFQRAIDAEGADGGSLLRKGSALDVVGRHREAVECWELAYHIDPGYLPTRYNHACALMALRDFRGALEAVRPVVDGHPSWAEAHLVFANALYETGNPVEALRHYQTAARLKPELPTAARNAAALSERLAAPAAVK